MTTVSKVIGGEVWVCVDCYQAHHYGAGGDDWNMREWETSIEGREFTDWTCSDHNGTSYTECDHCEERNYETGIDEFSKVPCDLCRSYLAGWRFRLAEWVAA